MDQLRPRGDRGFGQLQHEGGQEERYLAVGGTERWTLLRRTKITWYSTRSASGRMTRRTSSSWFYWETGQGWQVYEGKQRENRDVKLRDFGKCMTTVWRSKVCWVRCQQSLPITALRWAPTPPGCQSTVVSGVYEEDGEDGEHLHGSSQEVEPHYSY